MVEAQLGKPAVPIITTAFESLARTNAFKRGMPHQRFTFVPHPVWGKSPQQLRADIEGNDPVSGEPMMQQIVASLTRPLNAEESKTGAIEQSAGPAAFPADAEDKLQQYYHDNGMTDYLPIVIPTEERVAAMLKGTSHKPDEVVGKMAAGSYEPWSFTVKQVAINAVMAGAKPEYFPVILAIAETGSASIFSSTNSFVKMVVINGPIRDQIGLNYSVGAQGPFAPANSTIGRAWTLLSKNLANGGVVGETYLGSLGNYGNWVNIVVPENEEASPYDSFHVQKGFKNSDSTVSTFTGWGIVSGQGTAIAGLSTPKFDHFKAVLGTLGPTFSGTVVMDPLVANLLKDEGYDTMAKLLDALKTRPSEPAQRMPRPQDINIIVSGGSTNPYWQYGGMRYERTASVDKWR
ncbi:MAG: hypothetical protein IT494_09770 [Gammaproteobacteria bacterium]|nr:hypothetical protein [Gammaproteobacteria bacterium]